MNINAIDDITNKIEQIAFSLNELNEIDIEDKTYLGKKYKIF